MVDMWAMIDAQVKVLQPFYDQIDATRKRLNLTPFSLTDPIAGSDGKHAKIDDAVNVTENRSATYMSRIIAGLMSSKWQTVVEGEGLSQKDAHKIEQFITDNLGQADEFMMEQYGLAGLDAWLSNHVCHTSLIGVHWMSYFEDGEYKVHCLPLDMRYTPFVQNKWVAPIFWRNRDDLLQELEGYEKMSVDSEGDYVFTKPIELKDTDNEVRYCWDTDKNELWVEKQLVFTQPNTYGTLPFVIVWTPSGFMFRDKGYLAHESPGLLFLNENLYDQLSRQLTIDATLGYNSIQPAYEYETKNPTGGLSDAAPRRGETMERPEGELHKPVPTGDINRAQLATRDEVNRLVDEAAPMAPRAYTSPPSAVEVTTEVELLDQLQNPRIVALQAFKQKLARLIISQCLTIGEKSFSTGRTGRQRTFSVADLKDPKKYSVSYQLMKQNKRLAIVNESRYLALYGKAPDEILLRDVLSVEDVNGWMRAMELQKAKAADPSLSIYEMGYRYAEEAEEMEDSTEKDLKNWESIMLQHSYIMLMRQKLQPALPSEPEHLREATKETSNAQGLVSLIGQRASNLPQPTKGV